MIDLTTREYIAGLERALFEYVKLGNGTCIISAKQVALGRAALSARPITTETPT